MSWIKSGIKIPRSQRSLAVVAGMKKRMTTQKRQKWSAKKKYNLNILLIGQVCKH